MRPEQRMNYSLMQLSETEQTTSPLNVIFIIEFARPYQAMDNRGQIHSAVFETSWDGVAHCVTCPETSVNISYLLPEGV
jgi:hypothetical protein